MGENSGHGQDPAGRLAADFAELEFADFVDFGAVFDDPIVAGQTAIQVAQLDIAADFLGADEADEQMFIVHVWRVGTAADLDVVTGLGHFSQGGFLQTAFGQSQF